MTKVFVIEEYNLEADEEARFDTLAVFEDRKLAVKCVKVLNKKQHQEQKNIPEDEQRFVDYQIITYDLIRNEKEFEKID